MIYQLFYRLLFQYFFPVFICHKLFHWRTFWSHRYCELDSAFGYGHFIHRNVTTVSIKMTKLLLFSHYYIKHTKIKFIMYNRLPRTSYVKMIDIWFIFTMFIPYTEVIIHTALDAMRSKALDVDDNEKLALIQKIMKYALPCIFIGFSIIFFSVGIFVKYA